MLRATAVFIFSAISLFGQASPRLGTVLLEGRPVTYEVRDGYAVVQGDILLGTAAEVESASKRPQASVVLGTNALWPDGTMYYAIDPDVPNQQRILDAVQYWNEKTPLKILPRNGEPNYVRFTHSTRTDIACSSFLGMRKGEQAIITTDVCSKGSVIHELGHAWGMIHEHERADRNAYVTVLYQNIDKRHFSDFDQALSSTRDVGYYDYDSIMHYSATGGTRTGLDAIETVPIGIPIGQSEALSAGDIDSVSRLYGAVPSSTTITTAPAGLTVVVDGVEAVAPKSFNWEPGSTHTVSVAPSSGTDPRYVFVRWSDNGSATHTITASRDQTVFCAAFQVQHRFAAAVGSGNGSVMVTPKSPDGYYPERQPVRITAVPADGHEFVAWTGRGLITGYGFAAQQPLVEVGLPDTQFNANFSASPVTTIDSQPTGRRVVVDGTSYVTPQRFTWTRGSTHTLSATGPQSSGNDTARHVFAGWEDGSTGARTVTAGSDPVTYSAKFTTRYLLTVSTIGQGTVVATPPSADGYYDAGTTVELNAQPSGSNTLRYWLGDLAGGNTNPAIVMDQQRAVTAYFNTPITFRVLSAASFQGSPQLFATGSLVAPGQIVTLFGAGLGPESLVTSELDGGGKMSTSLAGTRVLFDGIASPVVYTSRNQVSAIVPFSVAGKTGTVVRVEYNGTQVGNGVSISAGETAPAMFTLDASGKGQVAALNQDGSVNTPSNPAAPGSVVVLYATGAGAWNENVPDGQIMGGNLVRPGAPVFVRLGKFPARVLYAGSAPGLVNGVLQINVEIPADLMSDAKMPVQLIVGAYASPPDTTIAVR